LPLAGLGRLPAGTRPPAGLAGVVERLVERVAREAAPDDAPELLDAAYILTGLRVSRPQVNNLFQKVRTMRESSAYQAILDEGREEGRAEGARELLIWQGRRRFGEADSSVKEAVKAITDLDRLKRMGDRIFDAASWQDLLATT
jgi:predicted transposase YdaD